MRTGIIDCGTNTFNLLIAERTTKHWETIFNGKINVRLGKGGFEQGTIRKERMARGVDALMTYYETLLSYRVDDVVVIATSAVRDAGNAAEFIRLVKAKTGLDVRVVDGIKEAELIFEGVRQTLDPSDENILVMDIGGGSTEFILANQNGILWKQSFPLGVSRIYEFLQPSDCLTEGELTRLHDTLTKALAPLLQAMEQNPARCLVGASGSFDTLVAMLAEAEDSQPNETSNEITPEQFEQMHQLMLSSTFEERIRIPGMLPIRADTMPLATALIDFVIRQCGIEKLTQSSYALKEGALAQLIDERISSQHIHAILADRSTAQNLYTP